MFVLPLVFLPFLFIMAVHRLVRIPVALRRGELQVPAPHRRWRAVAGTAAYLLLMGYTAALAGAVLHALFAAQDAVAAWLSLLGYVFAYPVVYLAAAWTFYHALKTP